MDYKIINCLAIIKYAHAEKRGERVWKESLKEAEYDLTEWVVRDEVTYPHARFDTVDVSVL